MKLTLKIVVGASLASAEMIPNLRRNFANEPLIDEIANELLHVVVNQIVSAIAHDHSECFFEVFKWYESQRRKLFEPKTKIVVKLVLVLVAQPSHVTE